MAELRAEPRYFFSPVPRPIAILSPQLYGFYCSNIVFRGRTAIPCFPGQGQAEATEETQDSRSTRLLEQP